VSRGREAGAGRHLSYDGLESEYAHHVIDHAEEYVDGRVHTNGLENFWSLLRRGINGAYVSVEPFHLFRYLDEQAFRYNERKLTDAERFSMAVSGIVGRRVLGSKSPRARWQKRRPSSPGACHGGGGSLIHSRRLSAIFNQCFQRLSRMRRHSGNRRGLN
jgi:hypothetical protein